MEAKTKGRENRMVTEEDIGCHFTYADSVPGFKSFSGILKKNEAGVYYMEDSEVGSIVIGEASEFTISDSDKKIYPK